MLRLGLAVVFCGTAAGQRSAARAYYHAGHGNKCLRFPSLDDFDMRLPDSCSLLLPAQLDATAPYRAFSIPTTSSG